jgi:hypothetical protein
VFGVQKSKTMFFHLAILCLWMGLSTFHKIVGGKGMFLCFIFFENEPVDTLLEGFVICHRSENIY